MSRQRQTILKHRRQKASKEKSQAGSSHNWNTLFLGTSVVADVVAQKYGVSKQDVLAGDGEQSAGLNVINLFYSSALTARQNKLEYFFPWHNVIVWKYLTDEAIPWQVLSGLLNIWQMRPAIKNIRGRVLDWKHSTILKSLVWKKTKVFSHWGTHEQSVCSTASLLGLPSPKLLPWHINIHKPESLAVSDEEKIFYNFDTSCSVGPRGDTDRRRN